MTPPAVDAPTLHAVAGELVRDLIRRDPALWAALQADPAMRREFGFDDELVAQPHRGGPADATDLR